MPDNKHLRSINNLVKKYKFKLTTKKLLKIAFIHRSWLNEFSSKKNINDLQDNERLEFLGDTVLGLIIAKYLYEKFPRKDEGELSKIKAYLVSAKFLAKCAVQLKLGEGILLGRGEEKSGGRKRQALLADAMEAVIGAVFLSEKFEVVEKFVLQLYAQDLKKEVVKLVKYDYKTLLQEICQKKNGELPLYKITACSGPDHKRCYKIAVVIAGKIYGKGQGSSKKTAEQIAASKALKKIEK